MNTSEYTSTEQAWNDLQATPSYVQRYQDDPYLYAQEELHLEIEFTDLYTDLEHLKDAAREVR